MRTREELEARIARLEDCLASGVRSVMDSNGERIEYMSATEMRRSIAALKRELVGKAPPINAIRFHTSKGL